MGIDETPRKSNRPSLHWPFEYIHENEAGEAVLSDDYLADTSLSELNIVSDITIDSSDHCAYSNLDFFYKLGVPSDSYITILAYNEYMKEEEWWTHILKVKYKENISDHFPPEMTQLLNIWINPVTYMNITSLNQNKKLFCKPISSDYSNHDLRSNLDLKLPKIKKLCLHTIKTLKKSENQSKTLRKFYFSLKEPIPLKINDILFVPKYDLFKVKSIVFEKDPKEDITSLGLKLPKTVEVGPLSYSKYPWYMLDPNHGWDIDIGEKRVSSAVPDLNHIMDYPFDVLNGYHFQFLEELRTYFKRSRGEEMLEIIILETSRRNQLDSILQGLAFNLNIIYDQESALEYCSVTGIKALIETLAASVAPGIFHIRHFKYLNLILEISSTGQPSKKDKDSIEIRLSNILKESVANLEESLSKKRDKAIIFIETERINDIFPEIRQACTKVIRIPNPEDPDDIMNLISRKELLTSCQDTGAYSNFISEMPKLLKKRSIDEIWGIMKKCIQKFNTTTTWDSEMPLEQHYWAVADTIWKEVDELQKSLGDSPLKVPEVKWKDVGGLGLAKHDILQTIELPLKNPGLFKNGLIQRGGLLLYGPPGTGKTLLAKAIATECELNFMSVKGPEILNMYVGESEKNIREIFEKARSHSPCVIFFDELDSLAPARGNGSDSNQVMDRIVAQLLTEIDGVNSKGQLFVIGATNRPDLLDPALLRPGRFDKKIYLGIAEEPEERVKILKAQTRKFDLDEDVDFEEIEQQVPPNFTGADFSGLTNEAYMQAARRRIQEIDEDIQAGETEEKNYLNIPEEIKEKYSSVTIRKIDFLNAAQEVTPSLTIEEIRSYDSVKKNN